MSAALLTRPIHPMYLPDPVDGLTRQQIEDVLSADDRERLGGTLLRGDLVLLADDDTEANKLFRVDQRVITAGTIEVYLLPVRGNGRASLPTRRWRPVGAIARVVPEVVLPGEIYGPADDDHTREVRGLRAQLTAAQDATKAADAAHEQFRSEVRRAVISEAIDQGWCDRTDEWLEELGLEGRPQYNRYAVASLDGGALMAVREDNDDRPWAVYNPDGSAVGGYQNYISDWDVEQRLNKIVFEGSDRDGY